MRFKNICVIGLGYVGLTLAVILAESGFKVFGIEKNKEVLRQLRDGKPHFQEKRLAQLLSKHKEKNLCFSKKIPANKEINVFIIAVGTPINRFTKKPNIEHVKRAVREIAPFLKNGELVILRSTVPVGTTRRVVLPILEKKCHNFCLSFCPERTVEGKALIELKTLPQIIGALDKRSMDKSVDLFSKITSTIVKGKSLEIAEMIKLINNSYRDLNFAYANQIALICKNLNLDAYEVIKAANFKYPRNNIPLPGFVGGPCLVKDSYILVHPITTNQLGLRCDLIKTGRKINEDLPLHVLERIKKYLKENKKSPNKAKVFISGFAFKGKPETDDLRASPTIDLLNLLKGIRIKNIYGHDFVVTKESIGKLGVKPCSVEKGFTGADVVIFMNNHRSYQNLNIKKLVRKMKKGSFFFDGWQLFSGQLRDNDAVIYEAIGFKK